MITRDFVHNSLIYTAFRIVSIDECTIYSHSVMGFFVARGARTKLVTCAHDAKIIQDFVSYPYFDSKDKKNAKEKIQKLIKRVFHAN